MSIPEALREIIGKTEFYAPIHATSDASAARTYEDGAPIEAMKAAIEKLRFDGFTLAA